MTETPAANPTPTVPEPGPVSTWLSEQGFDNKPLETDHLGVEIIGIDSQYLEVIVIALKANGFDYLQCQGGYDEGPGEQIVCFYQLVALSEKINDKKNTLREVRLKVFLPRDCSAKVPTLYKVFRGSDWQERETYDMFGVEFEGHPHPKRLLMPEDWKGWPLRKDYVQPEFYEMQDAY